MLMSASVTGVQALGLIFFGLMLRAVGAIDNTQPEPPQYYPGDPSEYYPDGHGHLSVTSNSGSWICPLKCQSYNKATGCSPDPYNPNNPTTLTNQTCTKFFGSETASTLGK
ncbi:putative signal peptide protein [Puccinia sorghi]|uniref:Putative signal peptide protein n=1 Tax=Puccinia sorghi TaxID=27349 RepID=A0A0L6V493_9BASI|nr:putative signal peptide protein [Puccinia sorghi]